MKQLVKIQTNADGKQAVSAREMYVNLGLDLTNWKRWAKKNIEKNIFATEGNDWVGFVLMTNGNETKDYVLTLDFAKKLSMQARTQRGEDMRNYFLEVEQLAIEATAPQLTVSKDIQELRDKLNRLEARTITSEVNEFSIHGYCGLYKIKVAFNEALTLGKLASAKCREQNEPIGKIKDYRFGIVNIYPEHVLKQVFEDFFKRPRF